VCPGYQSIQNICNATVTCRYTLNGVSGCVFPQPGANDCFIYNPNQAVVSVTCTVSSDVTCENAIGCQ
jgi:hypothetical protein